MLDKNDLKVLLDIVDNHHFECEKWNEKNGFHWPTKKYPLSKLKTLLAIIDKLQTMIKEMEGKQNGNN